MNTAATKAVVSRVIVVRNDANDGATYTYEYMLFDDGALKKFYFTQTILDNDLDVGQLLADSVTAVNTAFPSQVP